MLFTLQSAELAAFPHHCTRLASLDRTEHDADKMHRHVRYLLALLEEGEDLTNGLQNKIKDKLEGKLGKVWQPNTALAYMNSFKFFADFMKRRCSLADDVKGKDMWEDIRNLLNAMCRSVDKRERERKANSDPKEVLTPEMYQALMFGKRMTQAKHLLRNPPPGKGDHSVAVHTLVRNSTILMIVARNAHRTGVLSNMTLEMYNSATIEEGGIRVIRNPKHKTSRVFGKVEVIVDEENYKLIGSYIDNFRPKKAGPDTDNVFLNYSGAPMDSKSISHALSTELGHAGIERKICATDLRKTATTFVCSVLPQSDWKKLADWMVSIFTFHNLPVYLYICTCFVLYWFFLTGPQ